VVVKALGRHAQYDDTVRSGAIGINANKEAYPLIVNVRPTNCGVAGYAGGLKVRVDMGSPLVTWQGEQGGTFDVQIRNILDFNPGKIEHFLPFDKRIGPWCDVQAVVAKETPETRIFTIYRCEGCGVQLADKKKFCEKCDLRVITCEHPSIGNLSLKECGNPIHPGYAACYQHLQLMGVAIKRKTGRPAKVRTVPNLLPPEERPGPHIRGYRKKGPMTMGKQRRQVKIPKIVSICVVD
jgi:hypothetical protein